MNIYHKQWRVSWQDYTIGIHALHSVIVHAFTEEEAAEKGFRESGGSYQVYVEELPAPWSRETTIVKRTYEVKDDRGSDSD